MLRRTITPCPVEILANRRYQGIYPVERQIVNLASYLCNLGLFTRHRFLPPVRYRCFYLPRQVHPCSGLCYFPRAIFYSFCSRFFHPNRQNEPDTPTYRAIPYRCLYTPIHRAQITRMLLIKMGLGLSITSFFPQEEVPANPLFAREDHTRVGVYDAVFHCYSLSNACL